MEHTEVNIGVPPSEEDDQDLTAQSAAVWKSWYLLGLQVWINCVQTSYVLAIQVYSSLPYGLLIYNGATKVRKITWYYASYKLGINCQNYDSVAPPPKLHLV